tara:strand:+ start:3548 stop:3835 length:288 start_codon:yes stop_codon:yes gene_type:complete
MDKKEIEKKIDNYQNEYLETVVNICKENTDDKQYVYYWERAKRLQKSICVFTNMEREIALNEAKEALEKAFTPEIEKMLEENGSKVKVWEEMEDE